LNDGLGSEAMSAAGLISTPAGAAERQAWPGI
jgi:hypothetical protein